MFEALEAIVLHTQTNNVYYLAELVKHIRPQQGKPSEAVSNIRNLLAHIRAYPDVKNALKAYIAKLIEERNAVSEFSEKGIPAYKGFFTEISKRISHRVIPPLCEPDTLEYLIKTVFYKPDDYKWIIAISDDLWIELFTALGIIGAENPYISNKYRKHFLDALVILATRIAALGLDDDLVEKLPTLETASSPFSRLHREIIRYFELISQPDGSLENPRNISNNYSFIIELIVDCEMQISYLRQHKEKFGVSMELTLLESRLNALLKRFRQLLDIHTLWGEVEGNQQLVALFKELITAENTKNSIILYTEQNTSYLAYKIVEHTSETGRHYIASDKNQYRHLFKYACGGGVIVGLLCAIKVSIYHQHFPPFGEAFFYSMNYALGFMLIHLLHFTLATKQPAMTASAIAEMFDTKNNFPSSQIRFQLRKLLNSQLISLIGNVLTVIPTALLVCWGYYWIVGQHITTPEKAGKLLSELHPIHSPSIGFAAIAGIYLVLSGLITGFYDNKIIYNKFPERIRQHPLLTSWLSDGTRYKLSYYLTNNAGGLAGNFYLGIFLGATGTIGNFIGLPIDIRHITFAAGNVALSVAALDYQPDWIMVLFALLGVLCIGFMNVIVSFGLSGFIALRSRQISIRRALSKILFS